ncbi:serine O-acetyltransferase [Aestuariivita boseongensis]|uniref:serine O-acetyltransferase n=1 Tax=Aestuariivita boseongensis TaxID=1470562 RepID=UPI000682CE5A|nr:serine acetyltransferase [Aestuariivita boseongensis]
MTPDAFAQAASATTPDWSRETIRGFWDPGRKLLRALRRYQAAREGSSLGAKLRARYWSKVHLFWSVVTQCDIPLNCQIGGGLLLPHPTGIVIHPDCHIGPNCLIFHQVTLAGSVTLGGHCDIGAGAKILGPLTIGDHVQVGANAVVTNDLPDGVVATGIPARITAEP